jgi:hypothetical protein
VRRHLPAVGQTFLSAGSGDFPVARLRRGLEAGSHLLSQMRQKVATPGQGCPGNRPTGMSALQRRRALAIDARLRRGSLAAEDLCRRFCQAAALCLLLTLTACHTPAPLPPADTTQPGWRLLNGQAIWLARQGAKEVAGELLVALGPRRDSLVQFSKTPFPLMTTRVADGAWQIEFGAGARRYGGRGQPPERFVWFVLADALRGGPAAQPWRAEQPESDRWRLTNPRTGERLEVWFSP